MRRRVIILALALSAAVVTTILGADGAPIAKDNWQNHPKIVEVRAIYNEVEEAVAQKRLQVKKKELEWEEPASPTMKQIFFDEAKRVRKYVWQGGSDDTAATFSEYYDFEGTLRFVFIEAAAVCGSVMEDRIYFDTEGKRIWEIQKYLRGPEGIWSEVWPEENMIRDPWKEFNED